MKSPSVEKSKRALEQYEQGKCEFEHAALCALVAIAEGLEIFAERLELVHVAAGY